jgi:ribosomal subunit interface protein
MQIPLQITLRDMPASVALEDHIREKAVKLEQFYPALVGCRVVVELPHKHKQHGKLFNVRIDLTVPGSEIVINRDRSEDVYVALRDAFDAANRKLEDYGRRQRGDVKTHEHRVEEIESTDEEDGSQTNDIQPN